MVAVVVGERLLVARFEFVVDLLGDAKFDLVDHLGRVEATETLAEHRTEQVSVLQVGHDRLAHAGVLDLHGDGALDTRCRVAPERAVNLADRRRSDRRRIELDEDLVDRPPELALDRVEGEAD